MSTRVSNTTSVATMAKQTNPASISGIRRPASRPNVAFLQEIKEDNHRLRELLCDISNRLTRPQPTCSRELVQQLQALRDQLAMHFALENAYGYFDDVIEVAPHLCEKAQKLRSEHDTLYDEFCQLVEGAERRIYDEPHPSSLTQLAVLFFNFQSAFHSHEAHENELILSAFDDDVSGGE